MNWILGFHIDSILYSQWCRWFNRFF